MGGAFARVAKGDEGTGAGGHVAERRRRAQAERARAWEGWESRVKSSAREGMIRRLRHR